MRTSPHPSIAGPCQVLHTEDFWEHHPLLLLLRALLLWPLHVTWWWESVFAFIKKSWLFSLRLPPCQRLLNSEDQDPPELDEPPLSWGAPVVPGSHCWQEVFQKVGSPATEVWEPRLCARWLWTQWLKTSQDLWKTESKPTNFQLLLQPISLQVLIAFRARDCVSFWAPSKRCTTGPNLGWRRS